METNPRPELFDCGVQNLATAIISQATKDFKSAYRKSDIKAIRETRRFFLSQWFEDLTELAKIGDIDGKKALDKLVDQCKSNGKKLPSCIL